MPRYMGQWFEIATFPNRFQARCEGDTSAFYERQPDASVKVVNRCRLEDGRMDEAVGVARQIGASSSPTLQVHFAPEKLHAGKAGRSTPTEDPFGGFQHDEYRLKAVKSRHEAVNRWPTRESSSVSERSPSWLSWSFAPWPRTCPCHGLSCCQPFLVDSQPWRLHRRSTMQVLAGGERTGRAPCQATTRRSRRPIPRPDRLQQVPGRRGDHEGHVPVGR